MRKIKDIKFEIDEITEAFNEKKANLLVLGATKSQIKKEHRKAEKEVIFLRHCLHYLETKPRKSFVEKQIADLENYIKILVESENYRNLSDNNKKKLEVQHGIPDMKAKIKVLKFLLQ